MSAIAEALAEGIDPGDLLLAVQAYATESAGFFRPMVCFSDNWFAARPLCCAFGIAHHVLGAAFPASCCPLLLLAQTHRNALQVPLPAYADSTRRGAWRRLARYRTVNFTRATITN